MRAVFAFVLCLPLTGCYVTLHGHQSTGGGVTTTTTSSTVTGSAKASGAKVSFSSGTPVSPSAPGGHVSLGKGASAVLVLGLVIADFVHYFGAKPATQAEPREAISETCSCYQKSDEVTK
ncbi:MAG: hypothetical protein HYU76_00855 [Betaproteobacteria bacterium]|nr:hypothetical protein [Betaproteobacteria bacterium]